MRRRPGPAGRGEEGFTLIEALVALAVLAAGLGAIGGLGFSSLSATRRAEARIWLTAEARKAFAALPDRAALGDGALSGALDGASWRLQSAPFAFEAPGAPGVPAWRPQALRLTVTAPTGERLVVDTVRLAPLGDAR